jgi:type II secretory pathway pseudopilin PulG
MNDSKDSQNRHTITWLVVAIVVLAVLLAIALPSFVQSRNTAAQRACIENLRQIKKMTEAEQPQIAFDPVEMVRGRSALLPEYRTEATNANNEVEAIRR